jgi:hypothetical protein
MTTRGEMPCASRSDHGRRTFWTNVGVPLKTRKWFKTRRTGRGRGGQASHQEEQP